MTRGAYHEAAVRGRNCSSLVIDTAVSSVLQSLGYKIAGAPDDCGRNRLQMGTLGEGGGGRGWPEPGAAVSRRYAPASVTVSDEVHVHTAQLSVEKD